jgi:tripartite-type tricarboxylate transporter receptor subunit TctC
MTPKQVSIRLRSQSDQGQPGKYSYASPGIGTPGHLVGEQFRLSLDLDIVNVPFKGAGEAVLSAVAGTP